LARGRAVAERCARVGEMISRFDRPLQFGRYCEELIEVPEDLPLR
jgi:hypothetical protein